MKIFSVLILTLLFAVSVFAQSQAEITATTTYLRKSPDPEAEKVQTLKKGDKIIVENLQEENGWLYVSTSNKKYKGWIRKEFFRAAATSAKTVKPAPPTAAPAPTPTAVANSTPTIATVPTPIIAAPRPRIVAAPTPAADSTAMPAAENPSPTATPTPDTLIEENEVLRVETAEVNLNVRVVNGNNRSVNNLSQADFKVYEDGVLQPITSLTTAEVPMINALVIDNSRSLRSQLKKVIEAGKILVGTNRSQDQSAVVRFVSRDKIEVIQDFTVNKNSLNNALDNLFVEGGQTAVIDAVYQAAKKVEQYQNTGKDEDVKLRALIVVSDGDDRGSTFNEGQLFELLRQSNVQIYAVGFVNNLSPEPDVNGVNRQEKAKAFLTRLAQETGGKIYFPNSIEELPQIAADVSGELRTQYLISYSPTNENRDGSFRKIKVEIAEGANKEKRTAITRTGRSSSPQQ